LAKRGNSTEERIRSLNGEGDAVLLIPVCR